MKLRWTRRALADLDRVAATIAMHKSMEATDFGTSIYESVSRLQDFPLLGRTGAYQDTRELAAHKSCLVTYRVRSDEAQVLQVWHLARNLASVPVPPGAHRES